MLHPVWTVHGSYLFAVLSPFISSLCLLRLAPFFRSRSTKQDFSNRPKTPLSAIEYELFVQFIKLYGLPVVLRSSVVDKTRINSSFSPLPMNGNLSTWALTASQNNNANPKRERKRCERVYVLSGWVYPFTVFTPFYSPGDRCLSPVIRVEAVPSGRPDR